MKNRFNSPLDNVRVASPCHVDWEQMIGNERSRFCGQCNLNVYNLSGMTRGEAEHLIMNNDGRLCVRYYRRADGSIITRDCPVGLRAIKRRVSAVTRAVASALLTFFTGLGIYEGATLLANRPPERLMGDIAVSPGPPRHPGGSVVMGPPIVGRLMPRVEIGKVAIKRDRRTLGTN